MKADKKSIFFIFVFILLVISIVYRILNPFVQQETDQLKFAGAKPVQKRINKEITNTGTDKEAVSVIELFLDKQEVPGKIHRDLFAAYPPKKKVKKRRQNLPVKGKKSAKQIVADDPRKKIDDARKYLTSYQWYGTYKSRGKTSVFLAKNKLVLVAKTGDRLDGKYLIEDIQDKYLKIKALDLNETLHLDMREFSNE